MKHTILLYALFLITSCSGVKKASQATEASLKWLEGKWTRVKTDPGESGHEQWKFINESLLEGEGMMIMEYDMAFMEFLKIVKRDDGFYYIVEMPDGTVTEFKFTELKPNGFVCENPNNDFPKKISYAHNGNELTAIISAGSKSKAFYFLKTEDGK